MAPSITISALANFDERTKEVKAQRLRRLPAKLSYNLELKPTQQAA